MMQPVPVYIEFGDHDRIERELDEQMGLTPKARPEKPWECLAGEAPVTCQHNRLVRIHEEGRVRVACDCGQRWLEVH